MQNNSEYNVCFQGASLDVGNRGCRALAASFISLVLEFRPSAKLNLLYGNRFGGIQTAQIAGKTVEFNIVNCRLSPKARISEHSFWILLMAIIQRIMPLKWLRDKIIQSNRWLKTLESAQFVGEIRGGDSFSDIYGLHRFLLGIIPCLIAVIMRKELILLPQTYGPFKSRITKLIARFILLRTHRIFARDTQSFEFVRELLGRKSKDKVIKFCPDIAFNLEAALPEDPDIQPKLNQNNSAPLIGLNISGLLYVGGFTRDNMFGLKFDYKDFAHKILSWLMEHTSAHVLLIPHVYWGGAEGDESLVCRELRESVATEYADRLHLIMQEYDQSQIKGIIGLCDFFIGSRMHSCIAALSQGVPTIGLAYSKKFYGVFQSIGAEQFTVDMRQKTQDEILEILATAFEKRKASAEYLGKIIPKVQEQVKTTFKSIL